MTELTSAAERILAEAARLAHARGVPRMTPDDLWRAILRDESRAHELLVRYGLPSDLRKSLGPDDERGEAPAPAEAILWSPEVSEILAAARQAVIVSGTTSEVGSEHLLAGLLAVAQDLAEQLAGHGVDIAGLRAALPTTQAIIEPLAGAVPLELPSAGETDHVDALRILDAAANRAREGARVVEDYVRFALDDPHLSRLLKEWRHEFTAAWRLISLDALLRSRDVAHDVGIGVSTPQEAHRGSLRDVVVANSRRVGEALRTLTEYSKFAFPGAAERFEAARYRFYTFEKCLVAQFSARERLAGRNLYLLATSELCRHGIGPAVRGALAGGAGIVQLREKSMPDRRLVELGRRVREWTRAAGALFIMNDRPDLAVLTDADGVHVGQDELSVRDARRIIGPTRLIGVSTHSLEQLEQAVLDGADYLGLGPVFPSGTKTFTDFPGLDFVRAATAATRLPAFAIGGINADNIALVRAAGAERVAVSGAICGATDPEGAARALLS